MHWQIVRWLFSAPSGDLTRRKLVPGLFKLYQRKLLPEGFAVLGIGRTPLEDATFRSRMVDGLREFSGANGNDLENFAKNLFYQAVDTQRVVDYALIKKKLVAIDASCSTQGNYLYYLSTPPSLFEPIARSLGQHGLHEGENGACYRRLIVEKPFGYDLGSARELNEGLHRTFAEKQIYRIDHYLGKETVQNMLVFRFGNGIYEPLWNRNYIDRVEVTAAEQLGVEGRGGYYEGAGALRDMFQNHLLNVVGMIAMEPPSAFSANAVRNETTKVFEALRPLQPQDVPEHVVRGQYTQASAGGKTMPGYREEGGGGRGLQNRNLCCCKAVCRQLALVGCPVLHSHW